MDEGEPPREPPREPPFPGGRDTRAGRAGAEAPDLAALARDWVDLWQSEIAAAAADREVQESWQRLAALWAGAASMVIAGLPRGTADVWGAGRAAGRAGADAAARPASAAAAPDPRDAAIERLARRVDELERKLAERVAEPADDGSRPQPRPKRRRRPGG